MKLRTVLAAAAMAVLSACGGGGDGGGYTSPSLSTTATLKSNPDGGVVQTRETSFKADALNKVEMQPVIRPLALSPWGPRRAPLALSASRETVALGGTRGRDELAQSITLTLNRGTAKWPWTITSPLPAWATASPSSGVVDASGAQLTFSPTPGTAPGSYSAVVTITAVVDGESVALPVTLSLARDKRKLLASEWGVGFASVPGGSVSTRTLTVADNFGGSLPWTALSSAPWLTVTTSGTTGSAPGLTLTANAAAAATNVVNLATVTLRTADTAIEPAVINVGFWRAATGLTSTTALPTGYTSLVADKVRPYVYAHNGGTFIDVYNAHLGVKLGTIANVGGALGDMTVAPDGSRLYVLDKPTKTAAVVDLASLTKVATITLNTNAPPPQRLLAIRTNGQDALLADGGNAYVDGKVSATPLSTFSSDLILAAPLDGRRVFAQDTGLSPAGVSAYDVDYSSMSGGVLTVSRTASASFINGASNGQDIAVNAAGTALYTASGAPYRCSSVDPTNLVAIGSLPGGEPYPNNVEVSVDGRILCGVTGGYSSADIWVHAPNGALLQSFAFASYAGGPLARQLVVTPDGMVAVALTDRPRVVFMPIGAP